MKIVLKLLTAPITLVFDLTTWIIMGLISCSTVLLGLVSGIVSLLAVAVLVTYSVKNGLILLTVAFLVSPMGIPMLAVKLFGILQCVSGTLKNLG